MISGKKLSLKYLLDLKRTGLGVRGKSSMYLLLFGCSLLGSGFLGGLLGSRLLSGLLGGRLLGSLLWLLGLWLLSLLDLLWLFSLDNLVGSSSLTRCSGHLEGSLGNSTLEGQADLNRSLGSINLVVGTDVLEDGLAR